MDWYRPTVVVLAYTASTLLALIILTLDDEGTGPGWKPSLVASVWPVAVAFAGLYYAAASLYTLLVVLRGRRIL